MIMAEQERAGSERSGQDADARRRRAERALSRERPILRKVKSNLTLEPLLEDVRLLLRLLRDYHAGRYARLSRFAAGAVVFTLLYVLSPIDLIPDFIPILGYADDIIVITICVSLIRRELDSYRSWCEQQPVTKSSGGAAGKPSHKR